jgi:hypothetical protein
MNTKYLVVGLSILLLATTVSISRPIGSDQTTTPNPKESPKNTQVDVPVWHVGDWWTYELELLTAQIVETNQTYNFSLRTSSLNLTVVEDTGTVYTVAVTTPQLTGDVNLSYILDEGVLTVIASFNDTTVSGTLVFNKADLGIEQIQVYISGKLHAKITQLPGITLRRPIPIRGAAEITFNATYDVPYTMMSFPFDLGSFWGRPEVNITLDGTVESRWLTRMYRLNNFAQKHWGIVSFLSGLLGVDTNALKNLSDMGAEILPVIHIGPMLQDFLGGNVFHLPTILPIFVCTSSGPVNVKAGVFDAYNISVLIQGDIAYAPAVQNIIKISGHFTPEAFAYLKTLEIQLADTSYI